ncbi:MFS transporter [Nocardia sp. NPDC050718]|uniref:MFS transporter n=1 Tax=Nocardia sp. NPDC050718 TaxID=3155788 RepID=UPI003406775B
MRSTAVSAPRLGRDFRRLWTSFGVSALGSRIALDSFALLAVTQLGAGAFAVAALAAVGPAAGAVLAAPLGGWAERAPQRAVLIGADLVRCAVLASVATAWWLGMLGYGLLVTVAAVTAAATIVFTAARGSLLRVVAPPELLLAANSRLEATQWAVTATGPPVGGVLLGLFGPAITVAIDAVSYLGSACALAGIRARESVATRSAVVGGTGVGLRIIVADPALRLLCVHTCLVNGLILGSAPVLTVLLVRDLGFATWQYGVVLGVPCLGGLAATRLTGPLVRRFGAGVVLRGAGVARVGVSIGLAWTPAGVPGMVVVLVIQTRIVAAMAVFTPVFATYRLERIAPGVTTRVLTAWAVTNSAVVAATTVAIGVCAQLWGGRPALLVTGIALIAGAAALWAVPLRTGR